MSYEVRVPSAVLAGQKRMTEGWADKPRGPSFVKSYLTSPASGCGAAMDGKDARRTMVLV